MKFYGKITVSRYAKDNWNPEITEIYMENLSNTEWTSPCIGEKSD